ncbi:hypothetical protein GCM10010912_27180 [Paenibacillus albidus]|uniref:SLH domain-containing protein n=1 Tax=Paenibacillus albidus TaxID=2041023 RepID=A0A917CCL7_9BACL|nr:S-layer homology domain-containing protein [Paenibacillus albidus]GGF80604.1 hypothetical protein GCM10010912_27180 [Paenibacillus albidus]
MKKFRHWLVLSLAVILMITSMSPAFAQTTGISGSSVHAAAAQQSKAGHWAEASIDRWTGNGIINGYEDGTFQPDRSITRAEFVNVLNKVFGFTAQADTHFSDVPTDAWYRSALSVAKAAGYYEGFPNNEAKASAEITRQDAVTLLARVFSLKPANGSSVTFKDSAALSSDAREAVSALSGVISGYESGAFLPAGKITRAEAITLVDRLVSGYFSVSGEFAGGNIAGNSIINTSGVLLKEAALSGNLYLTAGIGSGEATLDGVTVKGHTFVSGGGENSVNLNQSMLNEVTVDRKEGRVRLHLTGTTRIAKVTLNSDGLLELAEGTIMEQVVLNHKAEIKLASGAKINSLVINESAANTSITGAGDIGSLIVQASGVTLNGKLLAPGTTVVIGGAAACGSANCHHRSGERRIIRRDTNSGANSSSNRRAGR